LLHEKNGTNQTMCLNERSFWGTFLSIHQNERKGISCIKMHATRIQNVIEPTSRATCCMNKTKLPRQCSVQLVARIRQNHPDNTCKSAVEK